MNCNGFTNEEIKQNSKDKDPSQIIEINLSEMNKSTIEGIEVLSKVRDLDLSCNQIISIEKLSELKDLICLNVGYNKIKVIPSLNLPYIQFLNLSFNRFNDCSKLSSLISLRDLNLRGNLITDLKFMLNLTNLITVDISLNPIKNIKGLGSLKKLEEVYLSDLELEKEILPNEFKNNCIIIDLNIASNNIESCDFLVNFTCLESLDISNNEIYDIKKIPKMINLEFINLKATGISTVKKIDELFPNLITIDISENRIQNIEEINDLEKLEKIADINLKKNPIIENNKLEEYILSNIKTLEIYNEKTIKNPGFDSKIQENNIYDQLRSANIIIPPDRDNDIANEKWYEEIKDKVFLPINLKNAKEVIGTSNQIVKDINDIRFKFNIMINSLREQNEKEFIESEKMIARQYINAQKLLKYDKFLHKNISNFTREKLDKITTLDNVKMITKSSTISKIESRESRESRESTASVTNNNQTDLTPNQKKPLKILPDVKVRKSLQRNLFDSKKNIILPLKYKHK